MKNRNLDFRQLEDPEGEEGIIGTMDAADYYGPQNTEDNVLHLLDSLKASFVRRGHKGDAKALETAKNIEKASNFIEDGEYELADQLLVSTFHEGGSSRAVYHAIAFVRDKLGK